MFTTGKKFFDKKNLPNPNQNTKLTQKPDLQKGTSFEPIQEYQDQEQLFSLPYEPEDEYIGLTKKFLNAKFNIGYQSFEKAFPFQAKEWDFGVGEFEQDEMVLGLSLYDENRSKMNQERMAYECDFGYEDNKEEFITEFENEEDDEEESLDEEESTKDNSNHLKEDNE